MLAIKQTLYRTSGDSPIVKALIRAAERGKQVAALVELKARGDEAANVAWARALEEAGVHVVYGLIGLKTHSKTALVVRQEDDGIRRYCHIGTGNYNSQTARLYEDLGLLTADPELGADLTDLFNFLTGYSRRTEYRRLLVAPLGAAGVDARTDRTRGGSGARRAGSIWKLNNLVDPEHHRRPVRGVPGRSPDRPDRARHLLPPARRAGPVGQHQGPQHRRPLPGALADLLLRDGGKGPARCHLQLQ